jgi:hypothetical protein
VLAAAFKLSASGLDPWPGIKFAHPKRVSLVRLYAIEAALRGCSWTCLSDEVKESLRRSVETGPAEAPGEFPGNRNRS